jgi:uncharacterized membrane protein YeaQ/YmgE (transglycosylase-associated protein family)
MARMRVALAQLNTVVGDLDGNVTRILDALDEAERAGADIAAWMSYAVSKKLSPQQVTALLDQSLGERVAIAFGNTCAKIGLLIVLASIVITGTLVRIFGPVNIGWPRAVEMALGFAVLYASVGMVLKTDRVNWSKATPWESGRLWAAWFITTIMTLGVYYYKGFTSLRSISIILVSSIFALSGIIFVRYRKRLIDGLVSRLSSHRLKLPVTRERVIIVGSGRTAEHIAWLLDHPTYSGKFQVLGFIDDDLRTQGMTIYGSKVIGRIGDISQVVQNQDVGLIILADSETAAHKFKEFRDLANFKPARVVVAPDIFGSLSGLGKTPSGDGLIGDLILGLLGGVIGGFLIRAAASSPSDTSWLVHVLVAAIGGITLVAVSRFLRRV